MSNKRTDRNVVYISTFTYLWTLPLTVYLMKGTIIVSHQSLTDCPGLEQTPVQLSEYSEREGDNVLFFSREGTLMTVICELLDKDVKYTLKLAGADQPHKQPVKVRNSSNQ